MGLKNSRKEKKRSKTLTTMEDEVLAITFCPRPACGIAIERTGGCELMSCPCGMHFHFTETSIHGENKKEVYNLIERYKAAHATSSSSSRASETPEERERRLSASRERARNKRASENPEERERRLSANRGRARKRKERLNQSKK